MCVFLVVTGLSTELLIKFLQSRLPVFRAHNMSSKLPSQKMADTSKDKLLLDGRIRHIRAVNQAHSSQVPACVTKQYC